MEEPLDALKRALHQAEKGFDRKSAETQEALRRLRLEREHLRAERDQLKAEVCRLNSDLSKEKTRNERERKHSGGWLTCCAHPSSDDPVEVNVTENFGEVDKGGNVFETRVPESELDMYSVRSFENKGVSCKRNSNPSGKGGA